MGRSLNISNFQHIGAGERLRVVRRHGWWGGFDRYWRSVAEDETFYDFEKS